MSEKRTQVERKVNLGNEDGTAHSAALRKSEERAWPVQELQSTGIRQIRRSDAGRQSVDIDGDRRALPCNDTRIAPDARRHPALPFQIMPRGPPDGCDMGDGSFPIPNQDRS